MNLYEFSYKYLLNQVNGLLSKDQLDSFINEVDYKDLTSFKDIYRVLIIILQDYQSMPNIINFTSREDKIKEILKDYDIKEISKLRWETIYRAFREAFKPKIINERVNCWMKYAKGVLDAAKFLNDFKSVEEFKKYLDYFQTTVDSKVALPQTIAKQIHGMGFALACSFLKEIGYIDYPKPDVHMMDVFSYIGLCYENDPVSCYKAVVDVSNKCNVKPYTLDKVIYLICSGNYYRYDVKAKESSTVLKERFIEALKERSIVG